jgi:septal ring factor EnvC (AmiA/AmiB activator)
MIRLFSKKSFLLCLLALLTEITPGPLFCAGDPKPATILVQELNMRTGPGRHHPVLATLDKGVKVLVLSYEGEWVRVFFEGHTGFVMNSESFIRIEEPGTGTPGRETKKEEIDTFHQQLVKSMEKIAAFSRKEEAIIDELDRIEMKLNQSRLKVAIFTSDLTAVEQHINELESERRDLENQIEVNETYVADRLTALYKLGWLGKFHVLASSESMFDFFINKKKLEQILLYDEVVADQLAGDLSRLNHLMDQLAAKKNEKKHIFATLNERIDTMQTEQSDRERLLFEIRSKKSLQMAAAESLKRSSRNLDRTVASFGVHSEEKAPIEVKEKPFASLKGLLMMPVKGKVVSFFGHFQDSKFNVTRFQSGIHIRADKGEPIRAVYSGIALYASWFKGFGNMLIIDHGNHYYTVYAHLEETFKAKGDPVETGEVIATVGDTGSLTDAGLHFEVRHHGKPMNPLQWIKKG